MNKVQTRFVPLLAVLTLGLAGCSSTPAPNITVTGSSAQGNILREVTAVVMKTDSRRGPRCSEDRKITAERILAPTDDAVAERWRVERCGVANLYDVVYNKSSGTGQVDFSVQDAS